MLQKFHDQFNKQLGETRRWAAFLYVVTHLGSLRRPVTIVETGCARALNNWAGDGQSTLVWDWLVGELGGTATSFDISSDSVAYARSKVQHANVVQSDSIIGLRCVDASKIDFLYLDSYDWTGSIDSPAHHLAELASVYPRLPSGCLIAVDDCLDGEGGGKHAFVKAFLTSLGIEPKVIGYVTVWIKP